MSGYKVPEGVYCKEYGLPFQKVLEEIKLKLTESGFTIFAIIDHQKAAESVGLEMFSASLIIFGNPAGGTNLMKESPTMAIDLPSKILVIDDGMTKIFFNKMEYIESRHSPGKKSEIASKFDQKIFKLLDALV